MCTPRGTNIFLTVVRKSNEFCTLHDSWNLNKITKNKCNKETFLFYFKKNFEFDRQSTKSERLNNTNTNNTIRYVMWNFSISFALLRDKEKLWIRGMLYNNSWSWNINVWHFSFTPIDAHTIYMYTYSIWFQCRCQ